MLLKKCALIKIILIFQLGLVVIVSHFTLFEKDEEKRSLFRYQYEKRKQNEEDVQEDQRIPQSLKKGEIDVMKEVS